MKEVPKDVEDGGQAEEHDDSAPAADPLEPETNVHDKAGEDDGIDAGMGENGDQGGEVVGDGTAPVAVSDSSDELRSLRNLVKAQREEIEALRRMRQEADAAAAARREEAALLKGTEMVRLRRESENYRKRATRAEDLLMLIERREALFADSRALRKKQQGIRRKMRKKQQNIRREGADLAESTPRTDEALLAKIREWEEENKANIEQRQVNDEFIRVAAGGVTAVNLEYLQQLRR